MIGVAQTRPDLAVADLDGLVLQMKEWRRMGVPIVIFIVGFGGGSALSARWLPDLGEGQVAGIAFFVICGLVGMVLALVALHLYEIVRQLDAAASLDVGNAKPDVIANGLMAMLRDIGPILGLAAAVYLLAPAPDQAESFGGPPEAAPGYPSE